MVLSKTHRAFFEAAHAMSQLSDFPRIKIGCVVTYGHRIISTGFNSVKTDPVQKKLNKYRFSKDDSNTHHALHAETMALKPLMGRKDIDFKNVVLYIARYSVDGKPMLSRPCKSCQQLLRELKIRKCYYTNYGGYTYEEFYSMEK